MSKPLNLLQVEDSQSDAALIVRLLENAGYDVRSERVETAPQMRAALERRACNVVIADYRLPQFDAPSALAILRGTGLDIPFLVVSGAVGEDRVVALMKAGAHDYVMKSNLTRLAPAVEREIEEAAVRRERRIADEALHIARQETERSHQLLDAVFTAQMDSVVVYNTAGIAIRTNPAAAAVFGFDPTGMGNPAVMEKLQLPAGPGKSATQRALAGETVVGVEQPAADRTFETCSSPMRDAGGQIIGAVTIVRDISERKRAEQRLEQARKLESIALLAGGIAHDFNNILTAVSGNITLALEESCPDCETKSVLPAALASVERAASLTRQLLAYAGTTIDQIAARHIGQSTRFPSLEITTEDMTGVVGACDTGYSCSYMNTISWRTPTAPLPMEINPRVIFERLFGDGGAPEQRAARIQEDRSILDEITRQLPGLENNLSPRDRTRLSEYLDDVREIERRLQIAETQSATSMAVPDAPAGVPGSYEEHAKLMFDLMALAYQTDLTRVFTFMLARELSQRSYPQVGVPDPHHATSHHQDDPVKLAKLVKIQNYHVTLFSHFLEKLRSTPDGDGNLLDHSLILYGSSMSNSNLHNHKPLPILVAGAQGGLKGGRHLKFTEDTPMANLLVSLLNRAGVPEDKVGDSTGALAEV